MLTIGHSAELPYVFGTVSLAGFKFTEDEEKLSDSMMQYWGNFIKYGNPNGGFTKEVYQCMSLFIGQDKLFAIDTLIEKNICFYRFQ